MPKTKAPYPTEFKSEAVRLCCESGKPMSMIARDLGVLIESLRAVRTLNPDAAAAAS
jgi:transposase-like protein